jgi:predicted MPP superfamily phosphohydrolase
MASRPCSAGFAVAAIALFTIHCLTPRGAAQTTSQRAIVVISDLHMGAGRGDDHFRWSQEFSAFLRAIDSQHHSAVDLVLNGDTFEVPLDEAAALTGLEDVIAAHAAESEALSTFAKAGSNRVVLIPGDADAALRFARVAERARRLERPRPRRDGRLLVVRRRKGAR